MRRRRFSERQRVAMWWVYTLSCIALYYTLFVLTSDFLTALAPTLTAIALGGLLVTWVSKR